MSVSATQIREFERADTDAVVALWKRCELVVPWNDPYRDIARKMQVGADLFLVATAEQAVVATVMGGYEGHRGWINYLAVDPERRGDGHGARLVRELETRLIAVGCAKVNLQVRIGNEAVIDYYTGLGYKDDRAFSMGKRLIPDGDEAKP